VCGERWLACGSRDLAGCYWAYLRAGLGTLDQCEIISHQGVADSPLGMMLDCHSSPRAVDEYMMLNLWTAGVGSALPNRTCTTSGAMWNARKGRCIDLPGLQICRRGIVESNSQPPFPSFDAINPVSKLPIPILVTFIIPSFSLLTIRPLVAKTRRISL
jgi:hypothetical protein